jgi:hypothetical protein
MTDAPVLKGRSGVKKQKKERKKRKKRKKRKTKKENIYIYMVHARRKLKTIQPAYRA